MSTGARQVALLMLAVHSHTARGWLAVTRSRMSQLGSSALLYMASYLPAGSVGLFSSG